MTAPTTEQLIDYAEAHGITITWHTGGAKGAWLPHTRTISLRDGMGEPQTRCTLAHELGHAILDHADCATPKHERQADQWAARLLITPHHYATTEHIYGPHPTRIAHELDVTVHMLCVFTTTQRPALHEEPV